MNPRKISKKLSSSSNSLNVSIILQQDASNCVVRHQFKLLKLLYLASMKTKGPRQLLNSVSNILPNNTLTISKVIRQILRISHKSNLIRAPFRSYNNGNTTPIHTKTENFDDIADINFEVEKVLI